MRRKIVLPLLFQAVALLPAAAQQPPAAMAGLSNQGQHPTQPYVTAGDRAYLIGTQDGALPDMGGHVPGEMGGLWLHPIKLIDGFQLDMKDEESRQETALTKAVEFINYPYGNRFEYGEVLDSLEVSRFQFSPDGHAGLIVQYTFRNRATHARNLQL